MRNIHKLILSFLNGFNIVAFQSFFTLPIASSILAFSAASTLSPNSLTFFSTPNQRNRRDSLFHLTLSGVYLLPRVLRHRVPIFEFPLRTAAGGCNFNTLLLAVPRSLAPTCTMPLASISKVTSICGTRAARAGYLPAQSGLRFCYRAAI